jgi:hypothetical protein
MGKLIVAVVSLLVAAYGKWFTENAKRHMKEVVEPVAIPTLAMDPKR